MNIRSMRYKTPYLLETLQEHHLDLLCITETWLLPSDVPVIEAALPDSYSFLHVPRSGAMGGGVGLIYSKSFSQVKRLGSSQNVTAFELMEISLGHHCQRFAVVVIYRPGHSGADRAFLDEFDTYLESVLSRHEKVIVCGDFNYWLDDPPSKAYTQEFLSLLSANNLKNHVQGPTHISGHTLDLILTPVGTELVRSVVVSPIDRHVSDHALLSFEVSMARPTTFRKTISFRTYNNLTLNRAEDIIDRDLVNALDASHTSAQYVSSYNKVLVSIRDEFCPLRTKEIIVRDDAPWYDHRVVTLRRQRRKAERDWRRLRTDEARAIYISARGAVVHQTDSCKVEYFQRRLADCGGDQRRTCLLLNSLLGRKQDLPMPSSVSDSDLASRFSSYFTTKIDAIREEINAGSVDREYSVDYSPSFNVTFRFSRFNHVTEVDVRRYLADARRTYCPLDPIDVSKLGAAYGHTVPAIVAIINSSFDEANFVISEKRGLIRPYLKRIGLDIDILANYRPVTNLSFLSKIIERAMLDQLVPFLEEIGLIPQCQSAYRKFHSTETALCKIYNDLVRNTCQGKVSLLVLLDLSAAFDTVDHQLLLNDFSNCGVDGPAHSLLRSYLSNREQRVVVGGSQSEPTILHCGVPQGSVLGPILFTVYTSTLASLLEAHGVDYHFYADDSQLYIKIENVEEAKQRFASLLSDVKIWMGKRRLMLNEGKTEIMVIKGNLRRIPDDDFGVLNLEGTQLVPVESAKNLGVTLDSPLSFRPHIDSLVKTCNFHIRNLYIIKKYINRQNLLSLIHSLIVSRVDYCNSLLIGLPNVTLKKIQSVLNRAARLVYSLPPWTPTTPFLIDLHWLPIKARIEFKICLIVFKALKFNQPSYIRELLHPLTYDSTIGLRSTDDRCRLHEPRAVGERGFANRSFSYMAPRLYNKLPISLRHVESLDAFKSQLKAVMFSRAYNVSDRCIRAEYAL